MSKIPLGGGGHKGSRVAGSGEFNAVHQGEVAIEFEALSILERPNIAGGE